MSRFATLSGSYLDSTNQVATLDPFLADTLTGLIWSDGIVTLKVEQSSDGTNWDYKETDTVTVANVGQKVSFAVAAPFIRATITNASGGTRVVRCSLRFSSAGPRA